MANRQLTQEELVSIAKPLLDRVKKLLQKSAKGDSGLHWALRRKIYKELMYGERGKPMHRRMLKLRKRADQNGRCGICKKKLPQEGCVLDRLEAMKGYVTENTRLLCPKCDWKIQRDRGFK